MTSRLELCPAHTMATCKSWGGTPRSAAGPASRGGEDPWLSCPTPQQRREECADGAAGANPSFQMGKLRSGAKKLQSEARPSRLASAGQTPGVVILVAVQEAGLGVGAPGTPAAGAARTYLALGRPRRRRAAVGAVVVPGASPRVSVEGGGSPQPPVWGDTWHERAGEASRGPGSPAPLAALTPQIPTEQEESEQQQQQQQRGGPQRPGAPSGQHGSRRGRSGRGATRGCRLHRGPCGPRGEIGNSALGGGARRPGCTARAKPSLTCSSGSPAGPCARRLRPGCGDRERGAGRSRPRPGLRFHLSRAER